MTTEQRGGATPEADRPRRGSREWFRRNPALDLAYRIGVGLVGTLVLVLGILLIPYPGPGWLVVFAGLAILGTEFTWARRLLRFCKRYYDAFSDWAKRQSTFVQLLLGVATFLVVVATLWLFGALALVSGWVGIDEPALESPIFG